MALKKITGALFKIPKKDVDTDQIIPARYLTTPRRSGLGPHCMEDLEFEGFNRDGEKFKKAKVLIVGENFGCGSSREHAVWTLQSHGIKAIIGTTFARIFRQNAIACGLPIIELKAKQLDKLFKISDGAKINIDLSKQQISVGKESLTFKLNKFDKLILDHGGLVGFANDRYRS